MCISEAAAVRGCKKIQRVIIYRAHLLAHNSVNLVCLAEQQHRGNSAAVTYELLYLLCRCCNSYAMKAMPPPAMDQLMVQHAQTSLCEFLSGLMCLCMSQLAGESALYYFSSAACNHQLQ